LIWTGYDVEYDRFRLCVIGGGWVVARVASPVESPCVFGIGKTGGHDG